MTQHPDSNKAQVSSFFLLLMIVFFNLMAYFIIDTNNPVMSRTSIIKQSELAKIKIMEINHQWLSIQIQTRLKLKKSKISKIFVTPNSSCYQERIQLNKHFFH